MVDGAIVLVDAAEGPMPQTKFVVSKALKLGLRPIVCVNKIDKPEERHDEVVNEVFDLFANLDATDEQLDFPIIYGSAKNGWMSKDPTVKTTDMTALFETVLAHVPPPTRRPRPVPPARHHDRLRPVPRPHPHRPRRRRLGEAEPDREGPLA